MTELIDNVQVFSGQDGRPAYVVMPYADYLAHFKDEEVTVPQEVIEKQLLEGMTPIGAWRKHLGLTQSEMANRLGISQGSYSGIEQSRRPRKETRKKVADAMNIKLEQLFYD